MRAIIAAAALLAASPAIAQETLDADGDGAVSFEEFAAAFPDLDFDVFASIDTDRNGMLSEAEIAAARQVGILPA